MYRFIIILLALFWGACTSEDLPHDRAPQTESSTQLVSPSYQVINVEGGGTIQGRVVLEGKKPILSGFEITANEDICIGAAENNRLRLGEEGGIAWAVVRLVSVKQGKAFPKLDPKALTIDQVRCRYTPHVIAAPVGATVNFLNSDPTAHNVRIEDTTEKILMNVAQPSQGNRNEFVVEQVGPHSIGCDYHPWMNAYVFGVDNPYYGVTGLDGMFTLQDIPPGTYELRLWLNGLKPIPKRDNRGMLVRYHFDRPYEVVRNVVVNEGEVVKEDFSIRVQ